MTGERVCRTCYWCRYNWCPPGKMIANTGDCDKWRMRKLTRAEKRKTKRQKEAINRA